MLRQQRSANAPSGIPPTQVHCLGVKFTSKIFANAVRAVPRVPHHFEYIVALRIFATLGTHQRHPALITLKQVLSLSGRLIIKIPVHFTNVSPSLNKSAHPVQFRTSPHT
ncbi:hypothetical protein PSV08DRAFT_186731 [Bipolaris maydis]|uniref:uncharacterized protein n=1 Tax=Cochliobolus heterostrophus TaxID=5016 RepID=UPI0024D1FB7A|nr:hypothetical protein PSV08DRAFT_186731 [Bipolaris maydis]